MRAMLTIVALCSVVTPAQAQTAEPKPVVYVGPQIRDGFADIDSGVRDSIRDVKDELQRAGFRLAARADDATLALIVLGRGRLTEGSVGFSMASASGGIGSGFGFVVPNEVPTLSTVLRVGTYQKTAQTQGGTWTHVAKLVVDDLAVWWSVNAPQVRDAKQQQ